MDENKDRPPVTTPDSGEAHLNELRGKKHITILPTVNAIGTGPRGNRWNFVDDYTLQHGGDKGMSGPPPEGSIYQCRGRKAGTNPPVRCKQWRLKGSNYCKFHGGRRKKPRGGTRLTRYYSKLVGPTLGRKLEELSQLAPDVRYSLCAEVDAARVMTEEAMRMFDKTHFPDPTKADKITDQHRQAAAMMLKDALAFVGDMVNKATKARAVNIGTVDEEQLAYIVDQVGRIVEEEIAEKDRAMADRFIERLRAVKMPERSTGIANDPQQLASMLRDAAEDLDKSVVVPKPEELEDESDAE